MSRIPLSKGYTAIVDDEDADLARYSWSAMEDDGNVYAVRYETIGNRRRAIFLHRIILERKLGRPLQPYPVEMTDHRNRNALDCRRKNVRLATHNQNMHNRRLQRNNSSGFTGVVWSERMKKWRVRIKVNGKYRSLGYFHDPYIAACQYDIHAVMLHGPFASTNFGERTAR